MLTMTDTPILSTQYTCLGSDGFTDSNDIFPDDNTEWSDNDNVGDGIGDNGDLNDDNDGIADVDDLEPYSVCSSALFVTNNLASGSNSLQQRLLEICPDGTITFDNDYPIVLDSDLIIPRSVLVDASGVNVEVSLSYENVNLSIENITLNIKP